MHISEEKNSKYTPEEMENKYRFQKRWQEKNGFITKSYRINGETLKHLLEISKRNNLSQAGILRDSFAYYENFDKKAFLKKYNFVLENKRIETKKGFKINEAFAKEIENVCLENNFLYGVFVTAILDEFLEYIEQG